MPCSQLRHAVPCILAIAALAGPALGAAEWYVAAGAAAGGTGSLAAPFQTISQGLAQAQPGDTVWLRGGTYRETIDFPRSGTVGAPITLAAYAPGGDPARRERVLVTRETIRTPGSGGFGSWQDLGGGRWGLQVPSWAVTAAKAGQFLVALDGRILQDARWPNTDLIPDISEASAAWSTAGEILAQDIGGDTTRDLGRYTVPGIDGFTTDALVGAKVQLNLNKQWGIKQGTVTQNDGTVLTFEWSRAAEVATAYGHHGDPAARDPVIIWDTPAALDRADEFWIDLQGRIGPANMLYIQSATSPVGRTLGFDRPTAVPLIKLSGRSYLTLRGFEIEGGSTGPVSASTSFIRYESMQFSFSSPGLGGGGYVALSGSSHAVVDCDFRDSYDTAIAMAYNNQASSDHLIEDSTFAMVRNAIIPNWAARLTVRRNTFTDTGSVGLNFNAMDSDFGHNHVYRSGLYGADISLINAVGSPPGPLHTRVHHNWAYAPRSPKDGRSQRWLGCNGIRTDSGFDGTGGIAGVTIDHNIVWGDGLNTGIQIFTNAPGKWGGGGIRGDSVDVVVAHNTVAASGYIQGCINLVGKYNAKGIEIVNNIASAYTIDSSIRSGASAPTLVAGNILTVGASNLPVDNDTRSVGRNRERIDPMFSDSVRRDYALAAGSPAIDAGVVHASNGTVIGAAPDIGALERGGDPWIAGALVQARHLPHLVVQAVTDPDGRRWAVLDSLPEGRLLPLGTRLQIGSTILADGRWSYDPVANRGRLWFALGDQTFADGTVAAVDPAGADAWTTLDEGVEGLDRRIDAMVWDDTDQTLVIQGSGFYGSPWRLAPVQLDRPAMGDLRQRPVYTMVPLNGGDPARFDLVATTDGGVVPLNHSQDRIDGDVRHGWSVLPDRWSDVFGPAMEVRVYATEHAGGGPRTHSAPSLSGAMADGRPEEVFFSVLTNPYLASHLRPEDAVRSGNAVVGWPDRVSGRTASAATVAQRPGYVADMLSGLPGIWFDGMDDVVGYRLGLPNGQFMAATVHRTAGDDLAPGAMAWQRVMSTAGSGTTAFGLSDYSSTGAAIARAEPWVLASTANAVFIRDEVRIAANGSSRYAGVIGEILAFNSLASDDDPLAPNGWGNDKAARDYLQTKYRNGPAGRLVAGSGPAIEPPSVRFAGTDLELVSVAGDRLVFMKPASAARIAPYGAAVLALAGGATRAGMVQVSGDATPPARPAAPLVAGNGTPRPRLEGATEPLATVVIRDDGVAVGTVCVRPPPP